MYERVPSQPHSQAAYRLRVGLYLAALLCASSLWYYPTLDPDLGWHLLGGGWMNRYGGVPSEDFINAFNTSWHDYHWLYQKLIYRIYSLAGFDGLRLMLGIAMAFVAVLVVDLIIELTGGEKHFDIAILAFLGVFSSFYHIVALRPQVFSLMFMLIALRRLMMQPVEYELPMLFFLCLLNVNMHVYWILIPCLWGIYRCLPRLLGKRAISAGYAWGGLIFLLSAGFLTPYAVGIGGVQESFLFVNFALLYDYLSMPAELAGRIGELRGGLCSAPIGVMLLLAALAVIVRAVDFKTDGVIAPHLVAALLGTYLLIKSVKFSSLFGALALPAIVVLAIRLKREALQHLHLHSRLQGAVAPALIIMTICYGLYYSIRYFPPFQAEANVAYMRTFLPLDACSQITQLGVKESKQQVRVLTHFDHGGWCRWAMHEASPQSDIRVTADGRTQWVPPEHYMNTYALFELQPGWQKTLDGWKPDVVLVSKAFALAQMLPYLSDGWRKVYEDPGFELFLKLPRERE